jgi:hypothetical protein
LTRWKHPEKNYHKRRQILLAVSLSIMWLLALGHRAAADGTGSAARFHQPTSVAVDSAGNVFVLEIDNCTIRIGTTACLDAPTNRPGCRDGRPITPNAH